MESRSDMFRRMVEMNNKQQPQMKQVLGQLGLKEENVLACWLVGSRLWGTARSESDWDFVFVLKDVGGERKKDKGSMKEKWTIHKNQFDAICYTETGFKEALAQHIFQSILVLFLLPPSFRLIEKNTATFMGAICGGGKGGKGGKAGTKVGVDINKFCEAVEREVERDMGVADKKAGKGLLPEARKVLCHSLRMLLISLQVADRLSPSLSPSSSASSPSLEGLDLWGDGGEEEEGEGRREEEEWEAYEMLKVEYSTDWGYLREVYGGVVDKLRGKLREMKTK